MATYNKFDQFTDDLITKVHNFSSDTFKVALTNTAPSASNTVFANITEIAAGNGYSAGGAATTMTVSTASGTAKVKGSNVTISASGGTVGPFRYAVFYNTTPTSPLKPLISWWDYGSSLTLGDGESVTVAFDQTNGIFTIT